jgi:hypothetical protein
MAVNFAAMVYGPCQTVYGRSVVVTPRVSLPGHGPYTRRGIFKTRPTTIDGGELGAIISDQSPVLYIREIDYPRIPEQGDWITVPADAGASLPPPGTNSMDAPPTEFIVTDISNNAGGETVLVLQRLVL